LSPLPGDGALGFKSDTVSNLRRLEPRQRRTQRIEARGMGKLVVFDGPPTRSLIVALVGVSAAGYSGSAAAVLQFDLAPKAAGMLAVQIVQIFNLGEEKQLRVSAIQCVANVFR
jgi:hypothetical protein